MAQPKSARMTRGKGKGFLGRVFDLGKNRRVRRERRLGWVETERRKMLSGLMSRWRIRGQAEEGRGVEGFEWGIP